MKYAIIGFIFCFVFVGCDKPTEDKPTEDKTETTESNSYYTIRKVILDDGLYMIQTYGGPVLVIYYTPKGVESTGSDYVKVLEKTGWENEASRLIVEKITKQRKLKKRMKIINPDW